MWLRTAGVRSSEAPRPYREIVSRARKAKPPIIVKPRRRAPVGRESHLYRGPSEIHAESNAISKAKLMKIFKIKKASRTYERHAKTVEFVHELFEV